MDGHAVRRCTSRIGRNERPNLGMHAHSNRGIGVQQELQQASGPTKRSPGRLGPRDRFLSGDLAGDRVRVLLQSIPLGAIGSLVAAGGVAWVLRKDVAASALELWLGALFAVHAGRFWIWREARVPGQIRLRARTWLIRLRVSVTAGGLLWTTVPAFLLPSSPEATLLITAVMAAVCGAGLAELAPDGIAALLFVVPPLVVHSVRLLFATEGMLQIAGAFGVFYIGYLALVARNTYRVFHEVSLLHSRATRRARVDLLTGLPNRSGLHLLLDRALARSRRNRTAVAVGYIDLDDFKPVNDHYGHGAGDVLLKELAQRWETTLHPSEAITRIGGDEFVVVVADLHPATLTQELEVIFSRLHLAVEEPFTVTGSDNVRVGMTMGVAVYPVDGQEGDALLRAADEAMYRNKRCKETRPRWWSLASAVDMEASTAY